MAKARVKVRYLAIVESKYDSEALYQEYGMYPL
jgi:hypothetical protein